MFATDGFGDAGCNIDAGIFLQRSKPSSGFSIESGAGKIKFGPSIGISKGGRGDWIQTGGEFFIGANGLGVTVKSSTGSGPDPDGISIERGVAVAYEGSQTVNFSLSVGDLARLAAAIVSSNYSHRIFGVESSQCGCRK